MVISLLKNVGKKSRRGPFVRTGSCCKVVLCRIGGRLDHPSQTNNRDDRRKWWAITSYDTTVVSHILKQRLLKWQKKIEEQEKRDKRVRKDEVLTRKVGWRS